MQGQYLLAPPARLLLLQSRAWALSSGNDGHTRGGDERRGRHHIPQDDGDHCEDGHRASP